MMKPPACQFRGSGVVFSVHLPELTADTKTLTPDMRRRAAAAICEATREHVPVHLDGANEPPAVVRIDAWGVEEGDEGWSLG